MPWNGPPSSAGSWKHCFQTLESSSKTPESLLTFKSTNPVFTNPYVFKQEATEDSLKAEKRKLQREVSDILIDIIPCLKFQSSCQNFAQGTKKAEMCSGSDTRVSLSFVLMQLRKAQDEVSELETVNDHLQKRLEKFKSKRKEET